MSDTAKNQYRQAYGLVRYQHAEYEFGDYRPHKLKLRDVVAETRRLPWLAIGAAYVSQQAHFFFDDPLNHPRKYLKLYEEKERQRKAKAQRMVMIPKAEYDRLVKGQKKKTSKKVKP